MDISEVAGLGGVPKPPKLRRVPPQGTRWLPKPSAMKWPLPFRPSVNEGFTFFPKISSASLRLPQPMMQHSNILEFPMMEKPEGGRDRRWHMFTRMKGIIAPQMMECHIHPAGMYPSRLLPSRRLITILRLLRFPRVNNDGESESPLHLPYPHLIDLSQIHHYLVHHPLQPQHQLRPFIHLVIPPQFQVQSHPQQSQPQVPALPRLLDHFKVRRRPFRLKTLPDRIHPEVPGVAAETGMTNHGFKKLLMLSNLLSLFLFCL